jgi:hypothetical protein
MVRGAGSWVMLRSGCDRIVDRFLGGGWLEEPQLARARDEGLMRLVGVTRHGVRIARIHLRSLKRI